MTRDEMAINSGDLGDIFGTMAPAKPESAGMKADRKEEAAAIPVPVGVKKEEKKPPVVRSRSAEMETAAKMNAEKKAETKTVVEARPEPAHEAPASDADELIKRAKEIEEELKGSKPADEPAPELSYREAAGAGQMTDTLRMFEELRRAMQSELASLIDKKAVDNMLLRTLEKSAVAYPILKNANWDHDGNLRLDGSIDIERLIKNTETCRETIGEADRALEEALCGLVYFRLKSVKLGLGMEKYAALCGSLKAKEKVIEAGYSAGTAGIIREKVLNNAIKTGDEEQ